MLVPGDDAPVVEPRQRALRLVGALEGGGPPRSPRDGRPPARRGRSRRTPRGWPDASPSRVVYQPTVPGRLAPCRPPAVRGHRAQAVPAPAPHDDDLPGRGDRRGPVRRQRRGDEPDRARPRCSPTCWPARSSCSSCGCSARWRSPTRPSGRSSSTAAARSARWAGLHDRLAVLVLLGDRPRDRGRRRRDDPPALDPGVPVWLMSLVADGCCSPARTCLGEVLRRVRVLVRVDQGRRDRRLHRDRRRLPARHRRRRLARPDATSPPTAASSPEGARHDPLRRRDRDLRLRRRGDRHDRRGRVRRARARRARAPPTRSSAACSSSTCWRSS